MKTCRVKLENGEFSILYDSIAKLSNNPEILYAKVLALGSKYKGRFDDNGEPLLQDALIYIEDLSDVFPKEDNNPLEIVDLMDINTHADTYLSNSPNIIKDGDNWIVVNVNFSQAVQDLAKLNEPYTKYSYVPLFTLKEKLSSTGELKTIVVKNQSEIEKVEKKILAEKYQPVNPQQIAIHRGAYIGEVLARIGNDSNHPYSALAKDLHNYGKHHLVKPVKYISKQEAESLLNRKLTNQRGFYIPENGTIYIVLDNNQPLTNDVEKVLMHEIIHAISYDIINNDPILSKQFEELFNKTKKILEKEGTLKYVNGKPNIYGMTNADEFFAEYFTNENFKKLLDSKRSDSGESVFQKILNFIANALGFKQHTTLGEEVIKLGDELLRQNVKSNNVFVPRSQTDFLTSSSELKVLFSTSDPQKETIEKLKNLHKTVTTEKQGEKTRYVKNNKKGIRTTEFNGSKILADYLREPSLHFDDLEFKSKLNPEEAEKYERKKLMNSDMGTFMHKLVELAFDGTLGKDSAKEVKSEDSRSYVEIYNLNGKLDALIQQAKDIKSKIENYYPPSEWTAVSEIPMFLDESSFTDEFKSYIAAYEINNDEYPPGTQQRKELEKVLADFKNFQGIGGRGDLVFINKEGEAVIVDLKFSSSEYAAWDNNKLKSISLQQAVYKQMLKEMGITTIRSKLFTGIIESKDAHKVFDKFTISNSPLVDTPTFDETAFSKIFKNAVLTKEEMGESANDVKEIEKVFFEKDGEEKKTDFKVTQREIDYFVKTKVKKDVKTGKLKYYDVDNGKYISFDEAALKQEISSYLLKRKHQRIQTVDNVKDYFKRYAEAYVKYQKDVAENPSATKELIYYNGVGRDAMTNLLSYYAEDFTTETVEVDGENKVIVKPRWEILEIPELSTLGIIGLINREMGTVEFIAVENSDSSELANLKNNTQSLLGNFANITTAHEYGINLLPTSSNINAMKSLFYYLSNRTTFEDSGLRFGGVKTINIEGGMSEPKMRFIDTPTLMQNAKGMLLFAKQRGMSLSILTKVAPELLNIEDVIPDYRKSIIFTIEHMLDKNLSKLAGRTVHYEEGQINAARSFKDKLKAIGEETREEVSARRSLLAALKERFNYIAKQANTSTDKGFLPESLRDAYKREMEIISQAIIDIENIKIYSDTDLSEKTLTLSENVMLTNPDDITKSMIVEMVRIQNQANTRIRDRMVVDIQGGGVEGGLRTIFKELFNGKDDERTYLEDLMAGRDILMKMFVGNKLPTYHNLEVFDKREDGTYVRAMKFRDPDNDTQIAPGQSPLTTKEKEFIKKITNFLKEYRQQRNAYSEQNHFEIPLMRGDSSTTFRQRAREQGVMNAIAATFKEEMDDLTNVDKALKGDETYRTRFRKRIEMSDVFAMQDNKEQRQRIMDGEDGEIPVFEDDLEYVIMNYAMNHIKKQEYDNVLPTINAIKSLLVLKHGGMVQNYPAILKYMDMMVRTNIYGRKGVIEEDEKPAAVMGRITSLISTLAIGLKPGAAMINLLTNTYQTISSLYGINASDIKKEDYLTAFTFVMRDMKNNLSNINALNYMSEYFGIHQMDPQKIISETREDKKGVLNNFNRWMHFMNSAPDFMFRMNMFIAEALTDGVVEIKNGKFTVNSAIIFDPITKSIKYDPKKDKRFSEYLNGNREHPDFLRQEALYIATQKVLKDEGFTDAEGMITRPYTTKQLYGMQKRADRIYQEMSPENKTWFEKTAIGNLVMMFKRWVLSKRNLYWKEAYIDDNLGDFEVMEYQDKKGQTKYIAEWKGRPMEGILNSLLRYLADVKKTKSVTQPWENLNQNQRNNLNHGMMDVIQWSLIAAIISMLGDDDSLREKKIGEDWIMRVMANSGKDLFIGNVLYSTATSPIVAISYTERVLTDLYNGKMPHLRIGLINDIDKIVVGYN